MALAGAAAGHGRGSGDPQALMDLVGMAADPGAHLAELPVRARPLLEKQWPWWADILAHPARDQFWQDLSVADRFEDITVPALNIGGWFDIFVTAPRGLHRAEGAGRQRRSPRRPAADHRPLGPPEQHRHLPDRQFGMMADALTPT